jgi:hypothetical protein
MRAVGFFVLISFLAGCVYAQGVSPTGKKDGKALYTAGRALPGGEYEFITQSKKSLSMIDPKNLLEPSDNDENSVWQLIQHKKTKFFSLHLKNQADLEKCVSTRWVSKLAGFEYDTPI